MIRYLQAHRVGVWLAVLTVIVLGSQWRMAALIDDVESEVDRSTRQECELRNEDARRAHQFAVLFVDILAADGGPETEGGRRLVADLVQRTHRLFPEVDC